MQTVTSQQPVFLNVDFIFSWLYRHVGGIFSIGTFKFLQVIATIIVVLLIALIFYCLLRLREFEQEDEKKKRNAAKASAVATASLAGSGSPVLATPQNNPTWQSIRNKMLSDSPSEWRLGIIEADIYMDKVFDNKGFRGDTLGDKLKNITPDQLASVQIAWEAHKVRNRIAHDGADFNLTMPESRRVLSYFEIVFRDLGVIE